MPVTAVGASRGVVLRGRVWPGGSASAYDDGAVLLDTDGRIARIGAAATVDVPPDVRVLGGAGAWVGPGVVDAHVHLAFGSPAAVVCGGVTAVRDLGAPPELTRDWRTSGVPTGASPHVAVAGPLLTAPGGYPSQGWGTGRFRRLRCGPDRGARDRSRARRGSRHRQGCHRTVGWSGAIGSDRPRCGHCRA